MTILFISLILLRWTLVRYSNSECAILRSAFFLSTSSLIPRYKYVEVEVIIILSHTSRKSIIFQYFVDLIRYMTHDSVKLWSMPYGERGNDPALTACSFLTRLFRMLSPISPTLSLTFASLSSISDITLLCRICDSKPEMIHSLL